MSSEPYEAASEYFAAEQSMILNDLVRHFSPMAVGNREIRHALDTIPAWREVTARERRQLAYLVEEELPGSLSASALLWELVVGVRAAAESSVALTRLLAWTSVRQGSAWSEAVWTVGDRSQWHRPVPARTTSDPELLRSTRRAERVRWTRDSTPSPPAPSPGTRPGNGGQP
jgi:hypothetical protein